MKPQNTLWSPVHTTHHGVPDTGLLLTGLDLSTCCCSSAAAAADSSSFFLASSAAAFAAANCA